MLTRYGGPEATELRGDVPPPQAQHGELLVRVRAAGLNPVDFKTRQGKLKVIRFKYVDFENGGRIERLVLTGATPPPTVAKVEEPKTDTEENKDDLQAAVDSGIKKIDDNNYEIDKSLVDKVLANPMAIAKGARVVPAVKNGKADG